MRNPFRLPLSGGCLLLLVSLMASAGTLDDIRALEADKAPGKPAPAMQSPVAVESTPVRRSAAAPAPIWHRLSDGRQVNLADWTIVLFMQSSCEYSQKFDPVLKDFSRQSRLPVFAFSMDGKGDSTFPNVLPATPDVMVEFFQSGLPVATPTTFLTHVNTMETYPLLQQAADIGLLSTRLDEVFRFALDRKAGKQIGKGVSQ